MEALEVGLSIAVYEIGHGMATQAFQTLHSCRAMVILLEHVHMGSENNQALETMDWLKASLLTLDRYVQMHLRVNHHLILRTAYCLWSRSRHPPRS